MPNPLACEKRRVPRSTLDNGDLNKLIHNGRTCSTLGLLSVNPSHRPGIRTEAFMSAQSPDSSDSNLERDGDSNLADIRNQRRQGKSQLRISSA
jgi:hypothetical protein